MNGRAILAIYRYEMARMWRTIGQSVVSPVLSTSLYFIVFGAAIGSQMQEIDGVSYGAFLVPGLVMLSLLTQSVSNAAFGIYFPKFTGTIYEVLSAPVRGSGTPGRPTRRNRVVASRASATPSVGRPAMRKTANAIARTTAYAHSRAVTRV